MSKSSSVVYVVTAWNDRTNKDTVRVFAHKDRADRALVRLRNCGADRMYGGVIRRTVKN